MTFASGNHRQVGAVARRLHALLEESIAPARAVQILVAESILPTQSNADPGLPLTSAISSMLVPPASSPGSVPGVVAHVAGCEARGRGEMALRLLARQGIQRAQGRTSLGVITVELVVLMVVLAIHAIFVLPQFHEMFDAAGLELPAFTRLVLAMIGPSSPLISIAALALLILLMWRMVPFVFGPLLRPLDRLLLALPLIGAKMRQGNSDRISGWLGSAAVDATSQLTAVEAARAWHRGEALSRACAEVLRAAATGKEIIACLKEARGFDSEFHAALAISDREDALAALRARWRSVGALPEFQSSLTPALVQTGIGIVIAAAVIAMYLPIFKLASLL
ncbi:MAG: hypothetical protein WAR01_08460 [Dokdonella sp.]|uniref:hypothetical protein n=1 Tax=Dokdonella sp. TaxID=2291710 RepID=UPI002B916BD6|nr:hypothetical protein [Xanthomonadales bacterium]HQV72522.1 hypothetical protein [Dokdonella sp.]HQX66017.1 hypothetical protein [Dokdonella sp.]